MQLFFSVGEPSGDLHGANLIEALRSAAGSGDPRLTVSRLAGSGDPRQTLEASGDPRQTLPGISAVGFGGPRMAAAACELLADMTELAVMGLFPVLARLPRFIELRQRAESYLRQNRPDAVVLIDYPGFNWHIARAAKEQGIPVFYYGLPQLWAWASWRVRKVRELVDHALCKLPFEETWFRERGCNATYVGHPYFDELRSQRLDHPFLDRLASERGRLVTILPGSRTQEVKNNLPQLLRAAQRVHQQVGGVRFAVASYNERQAVLARRLIERSVWSSRSARRHSARGASGPRVKQSELAIEVHVGHAPELILSAEACLACSGSVSLKLLYHARPSVILYQVPWWTYAATRRLVKVRYITLVNLLTADGLYADAEHPDFYERNVPGHEHVLFPEYPTWRDRSADIAGHVIQWLTDEPARQRVIAGLTALGQRVARGGASQTAAEYILRHLRSSQPIRLPAPPARRPAAYRQASSAPRAGRRIIHTQSRRSHRSRTSAVILAEPPRTAYDLNFQLLGFPVRIHPLFWLVGFVLGFRGGGGADGPDPIAILTWMMVLLVSILIHELGHAILIRRFGRPAHIVLYMMGGLAIEGEDTPYSAWSSHSTSSFSRRSRTPWEQVVISFAGPAAGFILAAFVIVAVLATGGQVRPFLSQQYVPGIDATLGGVMADNDHLRHLVLGLLYFNIFWGLVNLLPVFPLDGGQIAQQVMVVNDPWGGTIRALWLSVFVGGAVALVAALIFQDMFVTILFASLAVSNYFTLQQVGGGGGGRPW